MYSNKILFLAALSGILIFALPLIQEGSVWKMKLNDRSSTIHPKSQLWDFARYWHGAILHDGVVYIIAGETPDNSELPVRVQFIKCSDG